MNDQIVKTISSPKGKERIVVIRRADGAYTYYRQCLWNRHKAGRSELFMARAEDGVWALPGPNHGIYVSAELAEQDAMIGLSWSADVELPAAGLDGDEDKAIWEIAELAEQVLQSVAPTAFVQAQEWAGRIDCAMVLPDGSVIGEMVSLRQATEARIRDAGMRLQQRLQGVNVPLHDELLRPLMILSRGDASSDETDPADPAAAMAKLPPAMRAAFEAVIEHVAVRKAQPKL